MAGKAIARARGQVGDRRHEGTAPQALPRRRVPGRIRAVRRQARRVDLARFPKRLLVGKTECSMRAADRLASARVQIELLFGARGPVVRYRTEAAFFPGAVEAQPSVGVRSTQDRPAGLRQATIVLPPVRKPDVDYLMPPIGVIVAPTLAEPRDDVPHLPLRSR